jgi:N-acetylneuraminate synthase
MMKIGNRKIGKDEPCFIIAEIGINHNSDIEIAKKMIDVAAEAGCDAAKFQAYQVSHMYSTESGSLDWHDGDKSYSYDIYESNKRFELIPGWIPKLMEHCKRRGILFMSSVFDRPSFDELEKNGIDSFKIGSSSLTNVPFLDFIAKKGLPVILSTGGGTLGEIEEAVQVFRKNGCDCAVLHCHLSYPIPKDQLNMGVLKTLALAFPGALIGFSDHSEDPVTAAVATVALGGKIIEKHITLDKKMKGPDHFFALEPDELKQMVSAVREAEKKLASGQDIELTDEVLGSSEVRTYESEMYLREFCYRTIIAMKDIKKGDRLSSDNIRILRPGKIKRGLEPKFYDYLVQGCRVVRDLPMGKAVAWDDLIEIHDDGGR